MPNVPNKKMPTNRPAGTLQRMQVEFTVVSEINDRPPPKAKNFFLLDHFIQIVLGGLVFLLFFGYLGWLIFEHNYTPPRRSDSSSQNLPNHTQFFQSRHFISSQAVRRFSTPASTNNLPLITNENTQDIHPSTYSNQGGHISLLPTQVKRDDAPKPTKDNPHSNSGPYFIFPMTLQPVSEKIYVGVKGIICMPYGYVAAHTEGINLCMDDLASAILGAFEKTSTHPVKLTN